MAKIKIKRSLVTAAHAADLAQHSRVLITRVFSSKLGELRQVESNPKLGEFSEVDGKIKIGTEHDVTTSYEIPPRVPKKKKTKKAHS